MVDSFDFDGEGEVLDIIIQAALGLGAFVTTQYFLHKYKDALYDWAHSYMKDSPGVRRVFLRAVKLNADTCKVYKKIYNKTTYVFVQLMGLNEDTKQLEPISPHKVPDIETSTRSLTEAELVRMGFIPEKTAKGMSLINENGDVAKVHELKLK